MTSPELTVALQASDRACAFLMDAYERFQTIADAPSDITTDADRQAQEIILQTIRETFPNDSLCAEEETATVKQAPPTGARLWIVDPIDGTRGFARKNGEFSVMIAFVVEGNLEVGLVAQPAFERLTYARRGHGCWSRDKGGEPQRRMVSTTSEIGACTLTQSRSKAGSKRSPLVEAIGPASIVETYSAGVKLALVARAEADVYLNDYGAFRDWDIAAGHLLVTEAGGQVTGLRGEPLLYGLPGAWQKKGLVATNKLIHDAAIERLSRVLPYQS